MAVAVILGSYRKHFAAIRHALGVFEAAGWKVPIPNGQPLDPGVEFVRLSGDDPGAEPADLELWVIQQALAADVVYFVIPEGYIGRTTSYELGYLLGAGKQLYVSDMPDDLPVAIQQDQIMTPEQLVAKLA